jgi:hypothetical protein
MNQGSESVKRWAVDLPESKLRELIGLTQDLGLTREGVMNLAMHHMRVEKLTRKSTECLESPASYWTGDIGASEY